MIMKTYYERLMPRYDNMFAKKITKGFQSIIPHTKTLQEDASFIIPNGKIYSRGFKSINVNSNYNYYSHFRILTDVLKSQNLEFKTFPYKEYFVTYVMAKSGIIRISYFNKCWHNSTNHIWIQVVSKVTSSQLRTLKNIINEKHVPYHQITIAVRPDLTGISEFMLKHFITKL